MQFVGSSQQLKGWNVPREQVAQVTNQCTMMMIWSLFDEDQYDRMIITIIMREMLIVGFVILRW